MKFGGNNGNMPRILVMSFNSKFFKAGISLIASIHRHSFDTVDEIVIYDLGLTAREIRYLNRCQKVRVTSYPDLVKTFFPGFMQPGNFAWKPFVIKDAGRKEGDLLFYLDAGIVALKDLKIIYDLIDAEEIFLVQDSQLNRNWTTPKAFELMNASPEEKAGKQLCAGILGYKVGGKYQGMIDQAYHYAQNEGIICGDRKKHRHDQSIYSVLAIRYRCPAQSLGIYGEWRGILSEEQVLYVHRRGYKQRTGLRVKPGRSGIGRWLKRIKDKLGLAK
jgi:hypothetical protein